MRVKTFVILALILMTSAAVPAQEEKKPAKKDEDRILGTWTMVSGKKSGENAPDEFVQQFRLTFKAEGKFAAVVGPEKNIDGTFTLDTTKKPMQIDLTGDGKTMEGICALDGDNLKLCMGEAGERPLEFESSGGSHTILLILQRAKK